MNKKIVVASLIYSVPCAIVSGFYMLLPAPMNSILWSMYIGFFITNALGPNIKKLPGYLVSQFVGWGWALAYTYAVVFFMANLKMSLPISMTLGVFIVTVLLCIIHFGFFFNSKYNIVPMMFAPVASYFAIQMKPDMITYLAASLAIGCVCAIGSMALWNMVFAPKSIEEKSIEA